MAMSAVPAGPTMTAMALVGRISSSGAAYVVAQRVQHGVEVEPVA
jgi:hypothetical protein